MMHATERIATRLVRGWEFLLTWIAVAGFCGFFLGITLAVLMRYVFQTPLVWSGEFASFCAAWMVFSGMAVATLNYGHISIDVFPRSRFMTGPAVRVFHSAVMLIMLTFAFCLAVASYGLMDRNWTRMQPALQWPYAWLYMSCFVGSTSMALFIVYRLFVPGDLSAVYGPDQSDAEKPSDINNPAVE